MILPKKICEQIDHYTVTMLDKGGVVYDKTTIFFKQWWKPNKVILIRRTHIGDNKYSPNPEHVDLTNQLHELMHDTWVQAKITKRDGDVISVDFKND